jgi:hypothetical protein
MPADVMSTLWAGKIAIAGREFYHYFEQNGALTNCEIAKGGKLKYL